MRRRSIILLFTLIALVFSSTLFRRTAGQGPHGGHPSNKADTKTIRPVPQSSPSPLLSEEPRVPIDVPAEQQERIGLKITAAVLKPVKYTIRSVGIVTADQRREVHVHSRISGWIERIYVDYIGKPVHKGQPLFELYSPDLVSTQQEYLAAKAQGSAGNEVSRAALERLRLWGVPQKEIDRLIQTRTSKRTVTLESPIDGYVIDKAAIQGMFITPDLELYYLADLSSVWIIVNLYEYDLAIVKEGDSADITLPYDPKFRYSGRITYIYPQVEAETRTAKARIELENTDTELKPGMFANADIGKDLGLSIVVPDDALIDTGARKIIFVKTAPSRFEPREVKIGPRVGDQFIILEGLKEGDQVVTSAHFLIDAESKFQAAVEKETTTGAAHGGGGHDGK